MNILKSLLISGLAITTFSCSAQDFKKTPGGLEYKVMTEGKGTRTANVGDIADLEIIFKIGDSTFVNTNQLNNNQPIEQMINAPSYKGDLFEGILLMKEGDKTEFRILADSMFAYMNQQRPPFVKEGAYATWDVTMHKLMTKEEKEKASKAKMAESVKKDEATILDYFFNNNTVVEGAPKVKGQKFAKGVEKQTAYKTADGLYYIYEKKGTGAQAENGKKVVVDYTGMKLDGTKFDSNVDPAFNHVSPFEFGLGSGQVIKGWDLMVAKMKVGDKVKVFIPSALAYGERGAGKDIKPFEVLVFEIELKEVK